MESKLWETISYLVTAVGSILLWMSYGLFGLISRRYQQVFGRSTFSTLIMWAPSGLLVYTFFLILKATPLLDDPGWAGTAQWVAYLCLLFSGLSCLIGVARFARVFRSVTMPGAAGAAGKEPGR